MANRRLPPIPKAIVSQLGPVTIQWVKDLKTREGEEALGLWLPETRTIELRGGLCLSTTWATLEHERVHMICWDAGVGIGDDAEERVADAISSARVAQMLHG